MKVVETTTYYKLFFNNMCPCDAQATFMVPATATPGLRKRHLRGKTQKTQKIPEAEGEGLWKTVKNPMHLP